MTQHPAAATPPLINTVGHRRALAWALRALCLTEIVSWGVLYYAFPVLSSTITQDTGWSTTTTTALFSGALTVSAVAGIGVGRAMHTHGPRALMTGGSVLAVAAVLLLAWSPTLWVFAAGWLIAGLAMSCVLYAPAFAAVTVWFGNDRVPALTAITLVAGLASTVFAPATAALSDHLSWRSTYLVLAVVLAALTIPVHWLALRPEWPGTGSTNALAAETPAVADVEPSVDAAEIRPVARGEFWLLAAGFTASSVCFYATVVNMVPCWTGVDSPAPTRRGFLALAAWGRSWADSDTPGWYAIQPLPSAQ